MDADLKKTVATNLRLLLGVEEGARGATKALIEAGISNGDATRALKGQTSLGLDTLVKLAKAVGCEPWQLCVPGLDPEKLPTLEPVNFRWPFRKIDPEVVTELVGTPAQQVENGLLATLAAVGIAPRKAHRKFG